MKKYYAILILLAAVSLAFGYVNTYDDATPTGGTTPTAGDDRIREIKAAIQERLDGDGKMHFPETGTEVSRADAGKFRAITFTDEDSAGVADGGSAQAHATVAANEGVLDILEVNTHRELMYYNETITAGVQITDEADLYINGTYDNEVNFTHTDNNLFADTLTMKAAGVMTLPTDTVDTTEANLLYNTTDDTIEYYKASAALATLATTDHSRVVVGTYTGTGADQNVSLGTGNAALAVIIKGARNEFSGSNEDPRMAIFASSVMNNWDMTADAATTDDTPIAQHVDGFTVLGSDKDVNGLSENYFYLALY